MSEWKTAKELAEELGCSTSAVFVAASKKHRLRKHLIEKQKRGSSAFFRVVPEVLSYEPAGLKNGVWEPNRTKTHGDLNRIPKPPLTIVQEAAPDDQWELITHLQSRIEKQDKQILHLAKQFGESFRNLQAKCISLESRIQDLETKKVSIRLKGLLSGTRVFGGRT